MLTIKKSTTLFLALAITCIASLLVVSCDRGKKITIDIPKDNSGLDLIHHFISEKDIEVYKSAFTTQKDSLSRAYPSLFFPVSEAFNKKGILSLLKAPDCVGIRIYYGVKPGGQNGEKNELRQIIVGVDSNGKDILIDESSIIAQAGGNSGGLESGQCPSCQTSNKR
jgi:hypothetical protein